MPSALSHVLRGAAVGLACLAGVGETVAQPADAPLQVWVGGGGAAYSRPLWAGIHARAGADVGSVTASLGVDVAGEHLGPHTLRAVSLGVGLHRRAGRLDLVALAGPAVVWGTEAEAAPATAEYLDLAGVAEVGVYARLDPRIRVGVEGRAHVRSSASTLSVGPALQIRLGGNPRLR